MSMASEKQSDNETISEMSGLLSEYSKKVGRRLDHRAERRRVTEFRFGLSLLFSMLAVVAAFVLANLELLSIGRSILVGAFGVLVALVSTVGAGFSVFEKHTIPEGDLEAEILGRVIARASQLLDRGNENFRQSFELEIKLAEAEMVLKRYKNE